MSEYFEDPELQDPDAGGDDAQFSWDEEFQRTIIALLITDRTFLLQSMDLVKPTYFTNKAHQKACSIVYEFFKKYRTTPDRTVLIQELKNETKEDKSQLYYLGEVNGLFDYFEPNLESREYFSDKIAYFAKMQALRMAFNKSLTLLGKDPEKEETWSKIYDMLRQAMNTDKNFEVGLEYFKSMKERYDRMNEDDENVEYFVTGYEGIDCEIKGGGYKRGEMIAVLAGSGIGKSVWMTNVTAANVIRGKKCLYIACGDANCDRVAERFDAVFSGLPVQCLYDVKDQIFDKIEEVVQSRDDKNLLVVKWFPSNSADINTIRAYLYQAKFYGFHPDMIVVDYVGEMKAHSGMPTHESRELVVKELRGMAGEEQMFLVTAMQPNRGSKEAQETGMIEEEHLADSFGQIRPLDACFSLNQNKGEDAVKVGRMWVIKQRFGRKRYAIYLKFEPTTLRIYQIQHDTYKDLMSRKKSDVSESVEHDLAASICKPVDLDDVTSKLNDLEAGKKLKPDVSKVLELAKKAKLSDEVTDTIMTETKE